MTDATSSARSGKFTKGQSGNPYGRPKKLKEPPAPDLAMQPSGWLALNESHRLQEVTINGVVQKRPVLDIATASIGKKAMQGSRLHYKILLDQTIEKEARIAERDKAFYKSMLEEKREGGESFA